MGDPLRYRGGVRLLGASAVLLLTSLSGQAAAAERYIGLAFAKGTEKLAYREVHWLFEESGVRERLVLYECPGGQPFARKLVRNSPSAVAPDFDFEDARDGYREGVRTHGVLREAYMQEQRQAPMQQRTLSAPSGAVVDAGFDAYVRSHWRELATGAQLSIPFLVPSHFAFMEFKLSDAHEGQLNGKPVTRLRMRLGTWYAFAAPLIDLAYEPDGSWLLQFEGPGSIRGSNGQNQEVRIVFPQTQRVSDVAAAEIAHARTVELARDCGNAAGH